MSGPPNWWRAGAWKWTGTSSSKAFYATKVVTAKQHESIVRLLVIFAQHLAMLGNQIFIQQKNTEPPIIKRAKEYIYEHHTEEVSLARAAKAVNMSTFYFCKMFKKVTGINFTDYLSRVRIEKAKNLLLNPNLRVSEIAFEVGFQSLTHFNRVFKKLLGQSPTEYRAQLLAHLNGRPAIGSATCWTVSAGAASRCRVRCQQSRATCSTLPSGCWRTPSTQNW